MLLLILGCPQLATEASAVTYFVNPGGTCNDTNAGTSASSPWCTPPGTRSVSNAAFLRTAWGAITTSNRVRCGDTILLRGGATHNSSVGGAWRLDPDYYTTGCSASSPISVTVATSGEWSASSGSFALNATGIRGTGRYQTNTDGTCMGGGFCGLITIDDLSGVVVGGRSSGQQLIIENVTVSAGGDIGGVVLWQSSLIEVRWMTIRNRNILSQGGAICSGWLDNSIIHDVLVDNWRGGPGMQIGMMVAAPNRSVGFVDVHVRNSGIDNPNAPNQAGDAFSFGGGEVNNGMGGNGGIWCVRCTSEDHFWNGTNSGGSTSGANNAVYRYRDYKALGNGRTNAQSSVRAGFESAGDNNCTGQESLVVITNSVFYNNFNYGWTGPHGGGVAVLLNNTFYRGGAATSDLKYDGSSCNTTWMNNIVQTPADAFSGGLAGPAINQRPVSNFNLYDFWSAGTQTFSAFRYSGTSYQQFNPVSFNNAASQSGWVGPNDRISTSSQRFNPRFVSTAGACNSAYSDGQMGATFASCNLKLQSNSDAIDAGTFWFRAANGGTNGSTITVQSNGQAGQMTADPRHYFVEPDSFLKADQTVGVGPGFGDAIQIEGCGVVNITNMTATTISFSPPCSWAAGAGVSIRWTGARPDAGAYEFGITGPGSPVPQPPLNLRIIR